MKSYRRKDANVHDYTIRYLTPMTIGGTNRVDLEKTTLTLDEIIPNHLTGVNKEEIASEIVDISVDGKALSKTEIDKWNNRLAENIDECDGGGAVGGDAGGASGDAGGAVASDVAGEMSSGISTQDVLGKCEPGKGFMGKDNFYIPFRVKHPLHRWEIANGGSKRKKDKKGKPKKTPYEKNMKVVVNMFEDDVDNTNFDIRKIISRLKNISKGVKSIDDVNAVQQKFEKDKNDVLKKLDNSKYKRVKQLFLDFGSFLKDVCSRKHKASWFTITMIAVGLIYVFSPIDFIPDIIPVVGVIDDAYVLKLIYDAIKDEFDMWKLKNKS